LTSYIILIIISIAGVGAVFWLMKKDAQGSGETVEKISPKDLKTTDFTKTDGDTDSPKKSFGAMFAKIKMPKLPAKKSKKKSDDKAEPIDFPADEEEKPKKGGLSKILSKFKKKDSQDVSLDEEAQEKPAKKSLMNSIFSKLKFGKKKDEDDDVPQATDFSSLKDKLKSFSKDKKSDDSPSADKGESLPLLKDLESGGSAESCVSRNKGYA